MVAPSRVDFENVTSLGVSYSWSHGQGASLPCSGMADTGKWIQLDKTVDLEIANLDLSNAGGSVVSQLAKQQDEYVNTQTHSIYANGQFAGNGHLTSYSVAEGSMSNVSITNLSYAMKEGGDPNEGEDSQDPVTRTESIKVSRDIKGKTYTIDHSYSVNFGSDFDLVSSYPAYADDPNYKSIDGRLALAEKEANERVAFDVTNYNTYIDLSPYSLGSGFDLTKINDACSGVFTTSNNSKDYINGNYSLSKQTVLRYTGADLDPNVPPYEVSYSLSWEQKKAQDSNGQDVVCVGIIMNGNITANEGSVPNCKTGEGRVGPGDIAESGFAEWVSGENPSGLQRAKEFFNAVKDNLAFPNSANYPLIDKILKYKKSECVPSVDKGGKNDGSIDFEFEITTCPDNSTGDGTQYEHSESTSTSFSEGGCDGRKRRVTEITVDGTVNGQCCEQLASDGSYPRWENVESAYNEKRAEARAKGPAAYEGEYTLRLASESQSINKYQGQGGYSYTWTDSDRDANCEPSGKLGCNTNYLVKNKSTDEPSITRYVNTVTAAGIVSQEKGQTLPRKTASTKIENDGNKTFPLTIDSAMEEAKCQLNDIRPDCVIDSLSVKITKKQKDGKDSLSVDGSVGGIDL